MAKIALYANSRQRLASYLPLGKAILQHGHDCALFHPEDFPIREAELDGYQDVQRQPSTADTVKNLKGFDVFFASEVCHKWVPQECVSVAVFHSLPDRSPLRTNYSKWIDNRPEVVRSFDYLVLPVKQAPRCYTVEAYSPHITGLIRREEIPGRRETLGIIPGGYPKLEYLDRQLSDPPELDTVIYCPTISGNNEGQVMQHGAAILRKLHEILPNDQIVFRPYPTDEKAKIQAVLSAVSDLPRIVLDRSVTGMEFQKRCRIAVTDKSSAALTFALCSGRPVIFADMNKSEPLREFLVGYEASGPDGLASAIEAALKDSSGWRERIRVVRSKHLNRPFDPCNYLAENASIIAAGGTHPDWLRVPRFQT